MNLNYYTDPKDTAEDIRLREYHIETALFKAYRETGNLKMYVETKKRLEPVKRRETSLLTEMLLFTAIPLLLASIFSIINNFFNI